MSDELAESQRIYREALDAHRDQRDQMVEDLRFSDPSDPRQWDDAIKLARETDPGGKRPCLVFDQTGQFVANVANQVEKNPPSIHAIPVSAGADKKAAEQIDGRFRHIEHASSAMQHYARAMTSAARAGVGYLIIRPHYVDLSLNWQEPRISSEPDPLKVVFDPWSVQTDGSDASFGYIITEYSVPQFKRKFPNKEQVSFGEQREIIKDDTRSSVLLAEEWRTVDAAEECVIYLGADGEQQKGTAEEYLNACQEVMMQLPVVRRYDEQKRRVLWRRMSGVDILEESVYPCEHIGIVPVYGYVSFVEGRMKYCGIPRRARAPQQAYNYHVSEMLAYIATAPKAPWTVPVRAIDGLEKIWDRASKEARAYLPYHDVDASGNPIAAPSRTAISVALVNHEAAAAQALRDIQASVGMYQANLGQRSNETSGVAIENRKEQGEASISHFPSHLAASLGHVGRIVMEMDAKLLDVRREAPTISLDESPGMVTVDPSMSVAYRKVSGKTIVNPNIGKYGVRVVVGASFTTQRSQTNAAFAEIMRGNRDAAPLVLPFWAQTLDFPGSDKFAQAAATMAPPPIRAILQPEGEGEPDPAMLTAQLEQCKAALQEATQIAKEAQEDADKAIADQAAAKRDTAIKEQEILLKASEIKIKEYEAETDRIKVQNDNAARAEELAKSMVEPMTQTQTEIQQPEPVEEPVATQEPSAELQALQQISSQLEQQGKLLEQQSNVLMRLLEQRSSPVELVRNETGRIAYLKPVQLQ